MSLLLTLLGLLESTFGLILSYIKNLLKNYQLKPY